MKYKGIELKEISEPQIFNPPKKMIVWDRDIDVNPTERYVYAIVDRGDDSCPVICQYASYYHCAEIPAVQESKTVTYREFAHWLAEGNGEVMWSNAVCSNWNYSNDDETKALDESLYVRKWDDTEWHKPTREYLGLEDKQMELRAEDVENIRSIALCKEKLKVQTSIAEEMEKMAGTYHTSYAEAVKDLYEKNKEIRHQKYKRCIAMAEQCKESLRLMRTYEVTEDYCNLETGHDAEYFCKKGDNFMKWRRRWLKISEQFKEAK